MMPVDYDLLKDQIAKVNKAFYDRVYRDPWLSLIFQSVAQAHIESQQTDFMLGAFGGPKRYSGRNPSDAHPHIFVDEQMWALREKYLREAFAETEFADELCQRWIRIDEAFKHKIVKTSKDECKGRYTLDKIICYPNPDIKKAG